MTEYQKYLIALLAKKLLDRHGLAADGWTFRWNTSKRKFGLCRYNKKTIELSSILSEHQTQDQIYDTLIHEVAHALTPGNGHGALWKKMAEKLGIKPSRLGSMTDESREKMKEHAPWAMMFRGKIIKTYYRKPTRTIKKLPKLYLKSCPEESIGKLEIVPNPQYKAK